MEAYRVLVSIGLSSNASAVLGVIGRDLLGLRREAELTRGSLERVKSAVLAGGSFIAGVGVLRGLWDLANGGAKEYVHQLYLMKEANISLTDQEKLRAESWRLAAQVQATTAVENLKLLVDLRNLTGSTDVAVRMGETLARAGAVIESVKEGGKDNLYDIMRAELQRGALVDPKTHQIDIEKFQRETRLSEAVILGTRGRFDARQVLNMQQQMRAFSANFTDEGLASLIPFAQDVGGFRAGTMLAAMQQQIAHGTMTKMGASWLIRHELLPADAVKPGGRGATNQVQIDPNRVVGHELLTQDPAKWIEQYVVAPMRAKGMDDEAITNEILNARLRQTTVGALAELARNSPFYSTEAANILRIFRGPDPYNTAIGRGVISDNRRDRDAYGPATPDGGTGDPTLKMTAFTDAWKNLLTALGLPIVKDTIGIISGLTKVLTDLAQWATNNPKLVGYLEGFAAALAAIATVGGGLAIINLGLQGFATALALFVPGKAVALGIATLTGALQLFTSLFLLWEGIKVKPLNEGEESELDKLFPNRGKGRPAPGNYPNGPVPPELLSPDVQREIQKQNYLTPPPAQQRQSMIRNIINLDGRTIATNTLRYAANAANAAPTGPSGHNFNMGPLYAGQTVMI